MNKKNAIKGIALVVVILIAAGIALFISNGPGGNGKTGISLDFTLDEFKFMGHAITEGDQLSRIMVENHIDFFTGAVCDKDFYAEKNSYGHIYIMCPAYHAQDDAPDSTIPEEERRRSWLSGYTVTDTTIPGNSEVVSMTISAKQKDLETYYEGPINIGDTMEEVQNIMQINAIKKYGIYDKEARYETYSFICNQGVIVFEEQCSGHRDEYDSYSSKLAYLADGHKITYLFRYPEYRLGIVFGESGTVEQIAVTYDPEGVLDQFSN